MQRLCARHCVHAGAILPPRNDALASQDDRPAQVTTAAGKPSVRSRAVRRLAASSVQQPVATNPIVNPPGEFLLDRFWHGIVSCLTQPTCKIDGQDLKVVSAAQARLHFLPRDLPAGRLDCDVDEGGFVYAEANIPNSLASALLLVDRMNVVPMNPPAAKLNCGCRRSSLSCWSRSSSCWRSALERFLRSAKCFVQQQAHTVLSRCCLQATSFQKLCVSA